MTCKGVCTRYKARRGADSKRYANGQKRCQICEIFIQYEGQWCPCCGYRLRKKPRSLRYKAKLRGEDIKTESNRKILVGFSPDGKPILEDA